MRISSLSDREVSLSRSKDGVLKDSRYDPPGGLTSQGLEALRVFLKTLAPCVLSPALRERGMGMASGGHPHSPGRGGLAPSALPRARFEIVSW